MSRLYDRLVTMLGDVKIFRYPFWVVYDPGGYKVRGPEMHGILGRILPGDILLRRYDGYLDGRIIPGVFSHAALYLGAVEAHEIAEVPEEGRSARFFEPGPSQVAHSTAEGVHLEDILTFFQNDGMALLRLPGTLRRLPEPPPLPGDLETWHPRERAIHDRLMSGEAVPRAEVLELVRALALGQLGKEYDFSFDFLDGHRLSCTEFVAQVYRCARPALGIVPVRRSLLLGLKHKSIIEPDAFLGSVLERLHLSESARVLLQERA